MDLNFLGLLSLANMASILGVTGAADCSSSIPGLHSTAPQGLALGNLQHWLILDSIVGEFGVHNLGGWKPAGTG